MEQHLLLLTLLPVLPLPPRWLPLVLCGCCRGFPRLRCSAPPAHLDCRGDGAVVNHHHAVQQLAAEAEGLRARQLDRDAVWPGRGRDNEQAFRVGRC